MDSTGGRSCCNLQRVRKTEMDEYFLGCVGINYHIPINHMGRTPHLCTNWSFWGFHLLTAIKNVFTILFFLLFHVRGNTLGCRPTFFYSWPPQSGKISQKQGFPPNFSFFIYPSWPLRLLQPILNSSVY